MPFILFPPHRWSWTFLSGPSPKDEIIDRHIHQAGISPIEKTLHQPNEKHWETTPFKSREDYHQKLVHVQALRNNQTVDHTDGKAHAGEKGQRPGHHQKIQRFHRPPPFSSFSWSSWPPCPG